MSGHFITFRFIRAENFSDTSGELDDVVKIKYMGKGQYWLNYTHIFQGQTQKTRVVIGAPELTEWLRMMLHLSGNDKEPFYRIQVYLPHFPTILLDHTDLLKNISFILGAVKFSMKHVPIYGDTLSAEGDVEVVDDDAEDENEEDEDNKEAETEEEDNEETEDEGNDENEIDVEDYSDMPPLISTTPTTYTYTYNFSPPYQGRHLFLDHDHDEATSAVNHDGTPA